MRIMIFIFGLVLSLQALAQIDLSTEREIRAREKAAKVSDAPADFLEGTGIRLSPRYYKGEILVYDCKDRHFVCTSLQSANSCRDDRSYALSKNRFELPCAPLKSFRDNDTCAKEQYKRMHEIPDTRWCYNDKKLRF